MSAEKYDRRENPAEMVPKKPNGEDDAADDDRDVRELRTVLEDSDFRRRMHRALDYCLDRRKKGCIGDRRGGVGHDSLPERDDFWD